MGKEEKKHKSLDPLTPLPHPYGAAHNINETLNQCGCGDSLSPLHSRSPPALNIPREEGKKQQQPKYNKYTPPISEQENNQDERSFLRHVKACWFSGSEHVCTCINIAPVRFVGFGHSSAEVTALVWE